MVSHGSSQGQNVNAGLSDFQALTLMRATTNQRRP